MRALLSSDSLHWHLTYTKWISKCWGIQLDHTLPDQVHTKTKVWVSNRENEMSYAVGRRHLQAWQPRSRFSQPLAQFSHLFWGQIHVADLLQVNAFIVCSPCPELQWIIIIVHFYRLLWLELRHVLSTALSHTLILLLSLSTGSNKSDLPKKRISLRISAYWRGIKSGDYFNQFKSLSNRLASRVTFIISW